MFPAEKFINKAENSTHVTYPQCRATNASRTCQEHLGSVQYSFVVVWYLVAFEGIFYKGDKCISVTASVETMKCFQYL